MTTSSEGAAKEVEWSLRRKDVFVFFTCRVQDCQQVVCALFFDLPILSLAWVVFYFPSRPPFCAIHISDPRYI